MTSVTLHRDPDSNITTATGIGRVTASDLWAALDKFYDDSPTLLALCDLSQADLSSLSGQELKQIVEFTKSRAAVRRGGRTAIVAPEDLQYGMARVYQSLAEIHRHPVAIRAFRAGEEALQWLQETS
jgi:hypothetical protein